MSCLKLLHGAELLRFCTSANNRNGQPVLAGLVLLRCSESKQFTSTISGSDSCCAGEDGQGHLQVDKTCPKPSLKTGSHGICMLWIRVKLGCSMAATCQTQLQPKRIASSLSCCGLMRENDAAYKSIPATCRPAQWQRDAVNPHTCSPTHQASADVPYLANLRMSAGRQ